MPERPTLPSGSVIAGAFVLLLVSMALLLLSAWYLNRAYAGSMNQFLLYAHTSSATAAMYWIAAIQILFSLVGLSTSVGLLQLREGARKAAIFLSTVPPALMLLALFFFLADSGTPHGAESVNALLSLLICAAEFLLLLPLNIWWFILFSRPNSRSQFH